MSGWIDFGTVTRRHEYETTTLLHDDAVHNFTYHNSPTTH